MTTIYYHLYGSFKIYRLYKYNHVYLFIIIYRFIYFVHYLDVILWNMSIDLYGMPYYNIDTR